MRKRSDYLITQIAQEFAFQARLAQDTAHPEIITQRIVTWTQGHPFLTYRLCHMVMRLQAIAPKPEALGAGVLGAGAPGAEVLNLSALHQWVDQFIETNVINRCTDLELLKHLRAVWRFISEDPAAAKLIALYRHILTTKHTPIDRYDPIHRRLWQSGLVQPQQGTWQVANPLYERIFDLTWVERLEHSLTQQASPPLDPHAPDPPPDPDPAFDDALLASSRRWAHHWTHQRRSPLLLHPPEFKRPRFWDMPVLLRLRNDHLTTALAKAAKAEAAPSPASQPGSQPGYRPGYRSGYQSAPKPNPWAKSKPGTRQGWVARQLLWCGGLLLGGFLIGSLIALYEPTAQPGRPSVPASTAIQGQ